MSVCHERASLTNAVDDGQQQCDISSLLEMLGKVTDRRSRRGLVYELVFVLALTVVAVLAGASNFRQISDQIADFPRSLLAKLGAKWCYFRGDFARPSERTVRRILEDVDADELDSAVGAWLRENARRDSDGVLALAIDGKVLKGAWTDEKETFTLFSAMIHDIGVTVAQRQVPARTNEITQVEDLMAGVSAREGEHVVVTMDAAHTQRDTADYLKETRGFDYVMTVKGNQPTLLDSVVKKVSPLLRSDPDHSVEERGHGRVTYWDTWISDSCGIDFPHARQVACIRRRVYTPGGSYLSKEHAWIITSGEVEHMAAADVHTHVRLHWGIENKSHYVRDTAWREDAQQIYVGSGPRVLATLRNLAAGLLRINGFTGIKKATEWIGRDRNRALPLLAT